jgi:hypothetical protein
MFGSILRLALALLLPVLLPCGAAATSVVAVPDEALVDRAAAIAAVTVLEVRDAADGGAATEVVAAVERALRGGPSERLVVREPGRRGDAARPGLWIAGAPQFAPGDRALLFLAARGDGTYRILHLMQGAFREVATGTRRLGVRALARAREVSGRGPASAGSPALRDLDRFERWVADRVAGVERPADYAVDGPAPITARHTFFHYRRYRMRWFDFEKPDVDAGPGVRWRSYAGGQPGLAHGGHAELGAALRAWRNHRGSTVRMFYSGRTTATAGLDEFDGVNAILFDAPSDDPFDCGFGGTLAIGGPWFRIRPRATYRGERFMVIVGADVVTNRGIDCFFEQSPDPRRAAQELFAHEVGHTLGLDHSCGDEGQPCDDPLLDEALMRAFIHDDGRGPVLGRDDVGALCSLYATQGTTPAECEAHR